MKVGIPKELPPERRVASVPDIVAKLSKAGMTVLVEQGAGVDAAFLDADYAAAGATLVPNAHTLYENSALILKVNRPSPQEVAFMRNTATLLAPLAPLRNTDLVTQLAAKKITAFSLDFLPRLARTQSMDVLSSMSSIAGYKSIILAADHLGKLVPMMTTAAGTILPAKIIVIGAGVAGLQAIATGRRLGGVVLAFDTRPAAEEQVKSLGADFVSLEVAHEQAEDAGGYAKEQSAAFYSKEQDILRRYLKEADIVVTTALIPGKRAPLLITADMVQEMKAGAVLVDLAAEQEGNCELTEPGKITVKHGVTLIGLLNLPSMLPVHASQLYAKNIFNFLTYLAPQLQSNEFDTTDELVKSTLILQQGEVVHPLVKQALQHRERA